MTRTITSGNSLSRAIAPEGIVDLFEMAGLKKPDISLLSDDFLAEVRGMPQKNLAVELLRKLLNDEIKTRGRKNLVQARSFAEMLEQTIRRYHNRAIETLQVIEELIRLAKEMNDAGPGTGTGWKACATSFMVLGGPEAHEWLVHPGIVSPSLQEPRGLLHLELMRFMQNALGPDRHELRGLGFG